MSQINKVLLIFSIVIVILVTTIFFITKEKIEKYNLVKTYIQGSEIVIDSIGIFAKNDSTAYMKVCIDWFIEQKLYYDSANLELKKKYIRRPLSFDLYSNSHKSMIELLGVNKFLDIQIAAKKYVFGHDGPYPADSAAKAILGLDKKDSIKSKELLKYFTLKKDEFDANNQVWVKPKSAPMYRNYNGIYCYFSKVGEGELDIPSNFRFVIQYVADDWLFIKSYEFSIDGKVYGFNPDKQEKDNGSGSIWEWCDVSVKSNGNLTKLIEALANAKTAKVKYIGSHYVEIKTIPQDQIKNIKRTLDLYYYMGGTLEN